VERSVSPLSVLFPFQLTSVAQLAETARICTAWGVDRLWLVESFGIDVWSAVAAVAGAHPQLRFGTAVTLMPLRHPLELATRVRTMAEVLPGRFTAGLGVSERAIVEEVMGGRYPGSPTTYAREYLDVLQRCLTGAPGRVDGRYFALWTNDLRTPDRATHNCPELLVGALGPRMAQVGADAAGGCITWLVPPALVEDIVAPPVRDSGGRVVALVPCLPFNSRAAVREQVERLLGAHLGRPHYAQMLRRLPGVATTEGLLDQVVDDVVAWGSRTAVHDRFAEYAAAGSDEIGIAAYCGTGLPPDTFRHTLEVVTA
jgi:5,10-methylenetetrahydromethanopterin reductase